MKEETKMPVKINGILAVGTNKSFVFIDINGKNYTAYISRETYYKLKDAGIKTGQQRYRERQKEEKK